MVLPDATNIRFDLRIIASTIEAGSRVLDLGCGNGDLLAWLVDNKKVEGTGIEQDKTKAAACIARGLSVLQGDKRFIFSAAAHAQRACAYLHGLQPQAVTVPEAA